jgi:hypothetical protein
MVLLVHSIIAHNMSQIIPIYIPTYISDAAYKPSRVLPRLFFYNGMIECETWYLESGSAAIGGVTYAQDKFPYFDNYSVVTGSFPTEGSLSLLFNNEAASYGSIPSGSLYTNYWETYISLLYNPKTRLLNCSAIIPLADYVKMELNDIVNFRGNYYHLRAINDYSLKDGTCNLQLLGPIITDTFSSATENTPVVTPCCTPTLNSVTQTGGNISLSFTLGTGDCSNCVATTIQSSTDNVNWGSNNTAGCTSPRTLTTPSVPTYYRIITNCENGGTSNASNSILLTPAATQEWYQITKCSDSSTLTTQAYSIGSFFTNERVVYSSENYTITNTYSSNPGGAQVSITSAGTTGCPAPSTATLNWSFSETGGALGQMVLYVDGNPIETRTDTSSGTWNVGVGDTIYVVLDVLTSCGPPDSYANVYTTGNIINDANCANNAGVSLTTSTYTVVSGDIGSTLTLNTFASCDGGCL